MSAMARAPRSGRPSEPEAGPGRPACLPRCARCVRCVIMALVALASLGPARPAGATVDFPGPVSAVLSQPGLSVAGLRLPGRTADDVVAGLQSGTLVLLRYSSVTGSFQPLQQTSLEGKLVGIVPWLGLPLAQRGVVVASTDPDRVFFVRVNSSFPYFSLVTSVPLDEDPGTMAWFGDVAGGAGRLAVSLPGRDQIAVLADQGGWGVLQHLDVGDEPHSLTAADLDGDGSPELVAAQRGRLSGDLCLVTSGQDGEFSARFVAVPDLTAGLVTALDEDGDGRDELAVFDRDALRVDFLRAEGQGLAVTGSFATSLAARHVVAWERVDGLPALLTGDSQRGASEFIGLGGGVWQRFGTYFPGCRPQASAAVDVDGDGEPDVVTVGAGASVLTLMLARPGPTLWGLPTLPLSSLPGGAAHGDFDGDGFDDICVSAALGTRLSRFAGLPDGRLARDPSEVDVGFPTGRLLAFAADGDPEPELAVLDQATGQIVVLQDDGAGGWFVLSRTVSGAYPVGLETGDVDGDGAADIMALTATRASVLLFYGDGAGGLAAPIELINEIGSVAAVLPDLDADGDLDVVGVDGSNRVWWRLNQGGRVFGPANWLLAGNGAAFLATGDLDGDDDPDIVVGCRTDQSLVSFENRSGTLVRRTGAHALDNEPVGVRVADLDDDGRGDVIVALKQVDRYEVYLGLIPWNNEISQNVPSTPDILEFEVFDLNGDGTRDLFALDGELQLGVAHLNVDPNRVAVEPQALRLDCAGAGGLNVRIEPGSGGAWRLEAFEEDLWRELASAAGATVGRLEPEAFAWNLALTAEDLATWGHPTALRLVFDLPGDHDDARELPVPACAGESAGSRLGGATWVAGPWPNPGNPAFRARVRLALPGHVRVAVYDMAGRRVALVRDGDLAAGEHEFTWDGRREGGAPVSAGAYLLRLETQGGSLQRKLVLVK